MKNIVEKWTEKLEAGDIGGIRVVYNAFATDDAALIRCAGAALAQQLKGMPRPQLCKLCSRFREFTSMEWFIDWTGVSLDRTREILPEEAFRSVLILGSFHPNGYFREMCMREMAKYDGMLFWLFFRVNDWVWNIRTAACEILEGYLREVDAEELFDAMPAFERLQDGRRRTEQQIQHLWLLIEERMSQALREMDLCEIPRMEPFVRKSLYRVMIQAGFFKLAEMNVLFGQEKIPFLKGILLEGILALPDCTLEWAKRYLADPSAVVRRRAVEYRYEQIKTCWQGLEEMLLDGSRGVREYAAYILERHSGLDIRGYYLEHLGDDKPEYAIMGLAEHSTRENVQALMECMERSERKILKCTLLALGCQEDFTDEELLWHYLLDDREDISKAAYVSLRKRDFYPGAKKIYDAYMEVADAHRKKYLLNLLLRENSWNRLPWLVRMYRRDMPVEEGGRILAGIRKRSMYGSISQPLHKEILLALKENGGELPEGVEKEILYDMKFLL